MSFLGVSNKIETATGMSMSNLCCYIVVNNNLYNSKLVLNNGLEYLQTIVFILVIAALVQFVEMVIKKTSPTLYNALGVYLPLITTNCVVLGVAILNIQEGFNLIQTIFNAVGASVGFGIALILISGIREQLEVADVPEALEGFPIALITAGLMSIAFLGFNGLV